MRKISRLAINYNAFVFYVRYRECILPWKELKLQATEFLLIFPGDLHEHNNEQCLCIYINMSYPLNSNNNKCTLIKCLNTWHALCRWCNHCIISKIMFFFDNWTITCMSCGASLGLEFISVIARYLSFVVGL